MRPPATTAQKRRYAVVHLGARLHYGAAVQLHRAGLLHALFTDAYAGAGSALHPVLKVLKPWLSGRFAIRLQQRRADLPASSVVAFNALGFRYSRALSRRPHPQVFAEFNDEFGRSVASHRLFRSCDAVFGFCQSSTELFRAAKRQGKFCVLEQMIAPFPEFFRQLHSQNREWKNWSREKTADWNEAAWVAREREEWDLADLIISPSPYVSECLRDAGADGAKIREVPYGISLPAETAVKTGPVGRPLHVLCAGKVDLRKGAPYLIEAARAFGGEKLHVRFAGGIGLRPERVESAPAHVEFLGQVARSTMRDLYQWADVFVLPSTCEGSATVIYEALSHGVPVVVTKNCGAPIQGGDAGIVLNELSVEELRGALSELIENPPVIARYSEAALGRRADLSLEAYGQRLAAAVS